MGFSRQEYWSGLPFPSSEDLPHPGIKPSSPVSVGGIFTTEPPGKPFTDSHFFRKFIPLYQNPLGQLLKRKNKPKILWLYLRVAWVPKNLHFSNHSSRQFWVWESLLWVVNVHQIFHINAQSQKAVKINCISKLLFTEQTAKCYFKHSKQDTKGF